MTHNKHFKEYFLFHEKSLSAGLKILDKDLGHRDYFEKMFMEHLQKENQYRALNKDEFEQMKNAKTQEKTQTQIKQQKKKLVTTLGSYKGHKMTNIAKIEDKDIQNYLNIQEQS